MFDKTPVRARLVSPRSHACAPLTGARSGCISQGCESGWAVFVDGPVQGMAPIYYLTLCSRLHAKVASLICRDGAAPMIIPSRSECTRAIWTVNARRQPFWLRPSTFLHNLKICRSVVVAAYGAENRCHHRVIHLAQACAATEIFHRREEQKKENRILFSFLFAITYTSCR